MSALKILIVEDSEIASDILTQALQSDSKLHVVGVARNGREALEMLPHCSPNLITMDVWMPVMNGFETVERIMADYPTPILVITSSSLKEDVQLSMRMLEAGALDVMEKPLLNDEAQWEHHCTALVARVKLLAGVKVITHLRGRRSPTPPEAQTPLVKPPQIQDKPPLKPVPNSFRANNNERDEKATLPLSPPSPVSKPASKTGPERNTFPVTPTRPTIPATPPEVIKAVFPERPFYQVLAIASSTGGPTALLRILQSLPPNLPCGILIVQHISDGFTQGLVDWLQRETSFKIKMAQNGDRVAASQVLIAPDGRDMTINSSHQIVTTRDGRGLMRPSADVMMRSVAQVYGPAAIGLVLTGMGNDGAEGLLAMFQKGAYTLAQDEMSSLIYGMPKAATDNGATREILALNKIANRLVQLLQVPAERGDSLKGGKSQ